MALLNDPLLTMTRRNLLVVVLEYQLCTVRAACSVGKGVVRGLRIDVVVSY